MLSRKWLVTASFWRSFPFGGSYRNQSWHARFRYTQWFDEPHRGLPFSALLVLGGMASAGIPGLIGFIAEFFVFQGSFSVFPIPTLFVF